MFDHFDFLAPHYDRWLGEPDHRRLQELLRLPSDGWMLDAGGGTGRVSSTLRHLVGNLVISDLSLNMLAEARTKGELNPLQTHVENLPFQDACFERILVVDAFHHFCNQQESIVELLRVLKPGGRLVIEEPNIHRSIVKIVALLEKITLMRSHFYSPETIQSMIAAHGLQAMIRDDDRFRSWITVDK
ncbi:hypothetical protein CSA56_02285 [candidate division KSB3 bacterium]|uniref:Methyltransferase type 11 domain-containing protein n=1 Tax=candidate division KSB3 bacterium TaxID=2044937 RepID=A0A2G6KJS7_9BACT|nr:MAG: hypothetical protein CSA56_02285 [candidate division KSB3 bacterium]